MIFLAIEETDVHTSLLVAVEDLSPEPTSSLKPQASSLSEAILADEERLAWIHRQGVDE